MLLVCSRSKATYRPSILAVQLRAKAHSTPPPTVQPTLLLLLSSVRKKVLVGATRLPAKAAAAVGVETRAHQRSAARDAEAAEAGEVVAVVTIRSVKATPPVA